MIGTFILVMLTVLTPFVVTSIGTRDPYRFWIRDETTYPLQVWNRGPLDAVQCTDRRDIRIHGANRIALITAEHTEFRLAIVIRGSKGTDGVRIRFRTTERDYAEHGQGGLALTLNQEGLTITEGTRLLATTDTIQYRPDISYRIAVEHDGQHVRIAVGCELFGPFRTTLPSTQYTLIESLGNADGMLFLSDIAAESYRH